MNISTALPIHLGASGRAVKVTPHDSDASQARTTSSVQALSSSRRVKDAIYDAKEIKTRQTGGPRLTALTLSAKLPAQMGASRAGYLTCSESCSGEVRAAVGEPSDRPSGCKRLRPIDRGRGRLERVKGIEPSYSAWKAAALPLSYTRTALLLTQPAQHRQGQLPFAPWMIVDGYALLLTIANLTKL